MTRTGPLYSTLDCLVSAETSTTVSMVAGSRLLAPAGGSAKKAEAIPFNCVRHQAASATALMHAISG